MAKNHDYHSKILWTGNKGTGTSAYRAYERTWNVEIEGKPVINCSNDPLLGGDPSLHNPEDLLISALSACHMLWYLHLCANAGVIVTSYCDNPVGTGETEANGAGKFLRAVLRPKISITADSDMKLAEKLHDEIHKYCFIARSINFPVTCEAEIITGNST
ncbi:MAG: OsmC family protein [Rhizobiaceae bacterium]